GMIAGRSNGAYSGVRRSTRTADMNQLTYDPIVPSSISVARTQRFPRRDFLRLGGISLLSHGLLQVLAARAAAGGKSAATARGQAKACIILFQVGGPYQCDTFDPKPDAPEEIRGPFRRIPTKASGVFITEALPQVARLADRFAIVRSVHHTIRCHNPAIY